MRAVICFLWFIIVVLLNPVEPWTKNIKQQLSKYKSKSKSKFRPKYASAPTLERSLSPPLSPRRRLTPAEIEKLPKIYPASFFVSSRREHHELESMRPGVKRVGIEIKNKVMYAIGYMEKQEDGIEHLCPFAAAIPGEYSHFARVKLRVDVVDMNTGRQYANKYIVIPSTDEVMNDHFFKPLDEDHIRNFEVLPILLAERLQPAIPLGAPGQAAKQLGRSQGFKHRSQDGTRYASPPKGVHQTQASMNLPVINHASTSGGQARSRDSSPTKGDQETKPRGLLPITSFNSWKNPQSYGNFNH